MIQQLLLLGQVVVVLLVYLFVWRVVSSARRDLVARAGGVATAGAPQDSTIIPATEAAEARRAAGLADPRIVVVQSEQLRPGVPFSVGNGLALGRAPGNDVVLDDAFVSAEHARLVPPSTLVDLESTNGTLVNGRALHGRTRLKPGDTFTLGSTTFRYEVPR